MIEVSIKKLQDKEYSSLGPNRYDEVWINLASDIANGILNFVDDRGYIEGFRNNLIVDLCCSLYVLGYYSYESMGDILKQILFDNLNSWDTLDAELRFDTVYVYLNTWHEETMNGVIDKMLDKNYWKTFSCNEESNKTFVVVD